MSDSRCVELCRSAGAGSMAIFHHDPDHEDDFMDKLETEARGEWNNVFVCTRTNGSGTGVERVVIREYGV
ncbi:MAG: hypothetical protein ACPGQV_08085 [Alphaproteobacteria bacterium]